MGPGLRCVTCGSKENLQMCADYEDCQNLQVFMILKGLNLATKAYVAKHQELLGYFKANMLCRTCYQSEGGRCYYCKTEPVPPALEAEAEVA